MASDKVGAGGKIEHHRTGFFQLLRQLRRAYLLRLRAGRHLGGWHPAFAQLAGRQRAQPRRLPAHLRQPRAGYRRPDAIVIQQHNARTSNAGEVVGLLHQLAAWRAQAAGIVTRRVLFGAADIKQEGGAVALLLPALQRGLIDDRHPGPFGKMRHLSGPGAGGAGGGIVLPLLLVRQRLAGQRPADSAIAQGMDRVWHAGVDQRLGADDAAGASGAVDDNRRLRGGRQALYPQGQLAAEVPPGPQAEEISPAQLAQQLEEPGTVVLDFTTSANFVARHIPGAWWLTRSQLRQALDVIPPAQRYVVTCGSSLLARYAVPEVAALTGKPVQLLTGGTLAWIAAGLPLAHGDSGLAVERRDRYRRPYEGTDNSAEAMQAYLEWEYGLVDQLARDGTHGFRVL